MEKANFYVEELWFVECPLCSEEMPADHNENNPMQPMQVTCEHCGDPFIMTYEREL